jgi:hypothetical protein
LAAVKDLAPVRSSVTNSKVKKMKITDKINRSGEISKTSNSSNPRSTD